MLVTIRKTDEHSQEFKLWLESNGYNVDFGIQSAVDDISTWGEGDDNEYACITHNNLWDDFCNQYLGV